MSKKCCEDESASCESGSSGGCGCCSNAQPLSPSEIKSMGKESIELNSLFEELDSQLNNALKIRHKILQALHENASEKELKEKMDKVLASQHPVLIQFVLGMRQ